MGISFYGYVVHLWNEKIKAEANESGAIWRREGFAVRILIKGHSYVKTCLCLITLLVLSYLAFTHILN